MDFSRELRPRMAHENSILRLRFIFQEDVTEAYRRKIAAGVSTQRSVYFRTLYGIRVGK